MRHRDLFWIICQYTIIIIMSSVLPAYGGPNDNIKLTLSCKVWETPPSPIIMTCIPYTDTEGNVEICDAPLLSNITKCMKQPTEGWTNTDINMILNLRGALAGYEKGYFYVTNSLGVTDLEGYPIIFADYDWDWDVDGKDVFKLASAFNGDTVSLQSLASGFGR